MGIRAAADRIKASRDVKPSLSQIALKKKKRAEKSSPHLSIARAHARAVAEGSCGAFCRIDERSDQVPSDARLIAYSIVLLIDSNTSSC